MRTKLPFFPPLRNFSSLKGCTTVTRTSSESLLTVKDLPNEAL